MSRSYVLNYVHCVFSTKGRAQLIRDAEPLWAYMRGIARNRGFEILAIGGTDNHVHALISVPARMHLVDIIRDLKANSSRFLKSSVPRFAWQDGYAGISVSPSQVATVRQYIANQEKHHSRRTFQDELLMLLDRAGVRYDRKYLLAEYACRRSAAPAASGDDHRGLTPTAKTNVAFGLSARHSAT